MTLIRTSLAPLFILSLLFLAPLVSFAAPNCTETTNILCWCENEIAKGSTPPAVCSTISSETTRDTAVANLGGGLGTLSNILGDIDIETLVQVLTPLIDLIAEKLSSLNDVTQSNYPVDLECLGELEVLEWQLGNGTDPDPLSTSCMSQIAALLSDEDAAVLDELFGDGGSNDDIDGDGIKNDEDGDIDGDGIANEDDDDVDGDGTTNEADGGNDGDGSTTGEEATACEETDRFNADCSPKVKVEVDGTLTFGENGDTTNYEQTGEDTFVDTETGEEFTWEEMLDREDITDGQGLFDSLFNDDDESNQEDVSGINSIIESILGSGNTMNPTNPAGSASGVASSFGDMFKQLFSGGSTGSNPFSSVLGSLNNIPGVNNILGGGSPGGGSPGVAPASFDSVASDFVGPIRVINPDGPNQIIWDTDAKANLNKTQADVKAVLKYVAERVDFPLHVTESWAPTNTHVSRSQHHVGKAFDMEGAQYTDEQRIKLTRVILSHPDVGGFGWYPTSKSFHFDTRAARGQYWSGPSGGPYNGDNFKAFCQPSNQRIHPLMCELVFMWNRGESLGDVIEDKVEPASEGALI